MLALPWSPLGCPQLCRAQLLVSPNPSKLGWNPVLKNPHWPSRHCAAGAVVEGEDEDDKFAWGSGCWLLAIGGVVWFGLGKGMILTPRATDCARTCALRQARWTRGCPVSRLAGLWRAPEGHTAVFVCMWHALPVCVQRTWAGVHGA